VLWAIKDEYIGNTFLDASASMFFIEHRKHWLTTAGTGSTAASVKLPTPQLPASDGVFGSALGPKWESDVSSACSSRISSGSITLLPDVSLDAVLCPDGVWRKYMECAAVDFSTATTSSEDTWPLMLRFSNGLEYGCDLLVCGQRLWLPWSRKDWHVVG
jgi:hypothetical protein